MCNEANDDCLAAVKLVTDWFVICKVIKKLLTALYADDSIFYFNDDSGDITPYCNKMGILSVDLNIINLHNTNYDENDPETIFHVRRLAWHIKFRKHKAF